MASTELTVKITPNDHGNPPGKLADAELHFAGGPLTHLDRAADLLDVLALLYALGLHNGLQHVTWLQE